VHLRSTVRIENGGIMNAEEIRRLLAERTSKAGERWLKEKNEIFLILMPGEMSENCAKEEINEEKLEIEKLSKAGKQAYQRVHVMRFPQTPSSAG